LRYLLDNRNCVEVYRNPGGSRAKENEYFFFTLFDANPFSQMD